MKLLLLVLTTTFSFWIASAPSHLYGYSYECFSNGNVTSVHVLTVDPKEHTIVPVRALGEEVARETVETLAIRHGAIAAINSIGVWPDILIFAINKTLRSIRSKCQNVRPDTKA